MTIIVFLSDRKNIKYTVKVESIRSHYIYLAAHLHWQKYNKRDYVVVLCESVLVAFLTKSIIKQVNTAC